VSLRLAAVTAGVALIQALIFGLVHPPAAALAVGTLLVGWGGALIVVLRTASLYRLARRRAAGEDAPPPSRSALGDAAAAPRQVATVQGFVWALESLWLGLSPFVEPQAALVAAVFAFGLGLAGAPLLTLGFRRVLRPWIVAFPPAELARLPEPRYSRRAAMSAAVAVLSTGFIATAVGAVGAETRLVALGLGLSMTAALAIVAGIVAARLARDLGVDVERMRTKIAENIEQGGSSVVDAWAPEDADALIVSLAEALESATTAIRRSADVEQRVKSSIEETQQKKTVFMASMSHDLRSPLNSIMGFSELLVSGIGGELTDAQRENVSVIQRSGSELLELLNDIIDSARLDASRLPLRQAWTPTVELLTEAIRKGRDMVALRTGTGKGFTIEEELQPGLPPLYVDSHRIVQAMLCLFRHATLAMEGGAIRLKAYAFEDGVRVSVTDAGSIHADEDRERVFEAFRAMTSASGRRIGGMGLSLSLARSLVRAHGGEIHYDASVSEGTTFVVSIPAGGPK